jgi:hypothetical protein
MTVYVNRFRLDKLKDFVRITYGDCFDKEEPKDGALALTHADATSLRDALIQLFPIDKSSPAVLN